MADNNVELINKARSAALLRSKQDDVARSAYRMRRAGLSYFQIAENLGVPEARLPKLMHKAIQVAADLVSIGDKQELLALEVERIDEIQAGVYADAISGDIRAAELVLKCIHDRVDMLDLKLQRTPEQQSFNVISSVVVPANDDTYAAALRAIASGKAG